MKIKVIEHGDVPDGAHVEDVRMSEGGWGGGVRHFVAFSPFPFSPAVRTTMEHHGIAVGIGIVSSE